MARIKYLSDGTISEATIHQSIIEYIDKHPHLSKFKRFIMHFPNEGKRSLRYGAFMKSLGMRKGVSDLFIAIPSHGFGGAWIELKSENGKLSSEQQVFLNDMKAQNYFTNVCYSTNDAIQIIEWYLEV
jgi:hypothetical protein